MLKRFFAPAVLAGAAALAVLAAGSPAKSPVPAAAVHSGAHAEIAPWGIDLTARDAALKPGDDFFQYANGHWLASHEIPADRTAWGAFDELQERSLQQVREILEGLPKNAAPGSNARKLNDYYQAYLDTAAIDRLGLTPARAGLDAIAAARTPADIAQLMGRQDLRLKGPVDLDIDVDWKDPDHYMVRISQSGLGLPDRDYYLKDEPVYRELRTKYTAHIERLLKLAGDSDAAAGAKSIVELESQIAAAHWPRAKRRERDLTYNPHTREELASFAPGLPWPALLAGAGLETQPRFIVRESDAVQKLAALFNEVPVPRWQTYLRYHYLVGNADVLPKVFDDEVFDFYGRTLHGQQEQRARWKRAVRAVDQDLGEAAGELYVKRYFPPSSKQQMLELVENLRAAYRERIEHLPWMGADTRKLALEKLAAFHPKIGYPDKWRDYSALDVKPGDAFGNVSRAVAFEWQRAWYPAFNVQPGEKLYLPPEERVHIW